MKHVRNGCQSGDQNNWRSCDDWFIAISSNHEQPILGISLTILTNNGFPRLKANHFWGPFILSIPDEHTIVDNSPKACQKNQESPCPKDVTGQSGFPTRSLSPHLRVVVVNIRVNLHDLLFQKVLELWLNVRLTRCVRTKNLQPLG